MAYTVWYAFMIVLAVLVGPGLYAASARDKDSVPFAGPLALMLRVCVASFLFYSIGLWLALEGNAIRSLDNPRVTALLLACSFVPGLLIAIWQSGKRPATERADRPRRLHPTA
jgi:hypothetical protein